MKFGFLKKVFKIPQVPMFILLRLEERSPSFGQLSENSARNSRANPDQLFPTWSYQSKWISEVQLNVHPFNHTILFTAYLPTYLPTYPLTYLLTYPLTLLPTCLLTCLPTYIHVYPLTDHPTHLHKAKLTLIYLPTFGTYLPPCLRYLPT